jgi:hypothetical protein
VRLPERAIVPCCWEEKINLNHDPKQRAILFEITKKTNGHHLTLGRAEYTCDLRQRVNRNVTSFKRNEWGWQGRLRRRRCARQGNGERMMMRRHAQQQREASPYSATPNPPSFINLMEEKKG